MLHESILAAPVLVTLPNRLKYQSSVVCRVVKRRKSGAARGYLTVLHTASSYPMLEVAFGLHRSEVPLSFCKTYTGACKSGSRHQILAWVSKTLYHRCCCSFRFFLQLRQNLLKALPTIFKGRNPYLLSPRTFVALKYVLCHCSEWMWFHPFHNPKWYVAATIFFKFSECSKQTDPFLM